jgi:hypothetical protein
MVTVAEREAWRLHSGESRATSLTVESSDGLVVWDRADPRDRTGERLELREALEMMRRIPERRRRSRSSRRSACVAVRSARSSA